MISLNFKKANSSEYTQAVVKPLPNLSAASTVVAAGIAFNELFRVALIFNSSLSLSFLFLIKSFIHEGSRSLIFLYLRKFSFESLNSLFK